MPSSSLTPTLALALVLGAVAGCGRSPTRPQAVPEECTPQLALPDLAVGEALRLAGSAAALLCPSPPSEDGDYLLVLHQASGDPGDSVRVRVRPHSLQWPGPEPAPAPHPPPVAAGRRGMAGVPLHEPAMDLEQHLALRDLERRELSGRVRPGPFDSGEAPAGAPAPVPSIGSLMDLNTQSEVPCEEPRYRTGEVMAVSSRAVLVADTMNPPGGFDASDYAHLAATFDTLVAPLTESAFGQPTNFAGHGRTILFFTQEVNRLSPPGANTVVLGFFFSRDLFPREETSRLRACAHSNEAEILYLLVPDPEGRIHGNHRGRSFVRQRMPSTLAHEYQHLINAGRRLHVVRTSDFVEATWLNEGLSHIAEELVFYRAAGLAPGGDLGIDDLRAGGDRVMNAVEEHQMPNVHRLRQYLGEPALNSPYDRGALLPTRGAAWHFLRYALDRRGGPPGDLLRTLVDGPSTGVPNLSGALGGANTLHEWIADWSVAIYADSRVPGIAQRHRDLSWNHASIFRAMDEGPNTSEPTYPLVPLMLRVSDPVDRRIMGGGSDYVRFGIAAGDSASVQLTVDGQLPPPSLRATLMRIR